VWSVLASQPTSVHFCCCSLLASTSASCIFPIVSACDHRTCKYEGCVISLVGPVPKHPTSHTHTHTYTHTCTHMYTHHYKCTIHITCAGPAVALFPGPRTRLDLWDRAWSLLEGKGIAHYRKTLMVIFWDRVWCEYQHIILPSQIEPVCSIMSAHNSCICLF